MIEIQERNKRLPLLEGLLAGERKSQEGHVMLSPNDARRILTEVLYSFYEEIVTTPDNHLGFGPDARVVTLLGIARGKHRYDRGTYDFTEALAKIEAERKKTDEPFPKEI